MSAHSGRNDAEQGGQHDAAGGKLLIVVELDGEHRGDGRGGQHSSSRMTCVTMPQRKSPSAAKAAMVSTGMKSIRKR
ncbi:MAG: hypothetical protein ACLUIR_05950 [Faecalibacterium prausnitzii]